MKAEEWQDRIADLAARGEPWPADVEAALEADPDLRAYARDLRAVRAALTRTAPEVAPPPALRGAVLRRARASRRRPWGARMAAALGLAAALTVALWWPSRPGAALAAALPDPAVVVALGETLVVASNGPGAPIAVVDSRGRARRVPLTAPRAAWFTEGVRVGTRVYLADAGNDRIVVVDATAARVVQEQRVPGGVAGLAANGGAVFVKTSGGELVRLGGGARRLAPAARLPMADVMDAVAAQGGTLFVTHHALGEVLLLNANTLNVQRHAILGGAPVALAAFPGGVLVLDHGSGSTPGALVWLDARGDETRRLALEGHPDKLALSAGAAIVSDRAGRVTRVDLRTGARVSRAFEKPMDVEPMDDGHIALADGRGGVWILDAQLRDVRHFGGT